jgi:hypothetical protein
VLVAQPANALMREVLRATRQQNPEAAEWLEIIDRFDAAVAAEAPISDLASIAHEVTGRSVFVHEDWNAVDIAVGANAKAPRRRAKRIAGCVYQANVRGRGSVVLTVERSPALVCSVEGANGRFGFVALDGKAGKKWAPLDHLVVERLAVAVGTSARRTREFRLGAQRASADVEQLLAGGLNDLEIATAARRAKLPAAGMYVVAALELVPRNAIAPEALAAIAERALRSPSATVRSTVIGRTVALVALWNDTLNEWLECLSSEEIHPGFVVHIGVGAATQLSGLPRSWDEAKESLVLRSLLSGEPGVTRFADLGVLHLLAQIPEEDIMRTQLFERLTSPEMHRGSPSDIDVLRVYLEEVTLRGTAARIFLHHTSVENRVRRIERHLGLDLTQPSQRFQAQLLLDLYRIAQARSATRVSA